ncbi:MAG: competence/damage-inducible protein A [Campylobacterales bacterium]
MTTPAFYAVIIGSEILNGRRRDAHVDFLRDALQERGYELKVSFIIKDDPSLIDRVFSFIKEDPDGVLFSFGGIGATPDDYTREAAARAFRDGSLITHPEALALIEEQFGQAARPYRIRMADLPSGAKLLTNPINRVPGFFLDDRYFFVPGFPEMAHPMVREALERFFPATTKPLRLTVTVLTGENDLIELMRAVPPSIELSSLPVILGPKRRTVLSLAGNDEEVRKAYQKLLDGIRALGFWFIEGDHPRDAFAYDEGDFPCCNS